MASSSTPVDISAAPRAVVSTAADLIYKVGRSMLGPDRVPTAKANAWAAVCADQERARIREENARIILVR
jgi:hypothetical protein